MAPRPHAGGKGLFDHAAIGVHALLQALELELLKDVVVGATGEHAGFLQPGLFHQAEVALVGPDPAGALRIAVAQVAAAVERVAVIARIEEELGLPDDAVRPAQFRHHIVDADHLVGRIGGAGLLAVAKGRVGDENVPALHGRGIEFHRLSVDVYDHRAVEANQRRQAVRKGFFQQIRFGSIDQRVRLAFRHVYPQKFLCAALPALRHTCTCSVNGAGKHT